jgi:hypothetical protein
MEVAKAMMQALDGSQAEPCLDGLSRVVRVLERLLALRGLAMH